MFLSRKTYTAQLELKADASGEFRATIATLGVIDRDGDVIQPGAFKRGQAVKVAAWGHNWDALPVGMGTLGADSTRAWVDGKFFLDTPQGLAHYQTVKALGPLQEWSFGFNVDKWSHGEHDGQDVRFIEGIDAFEVSPVMLGAGIGTGTDSIKSAMAELVKAADAPPTPDPDQAEPELEADESKADDTPLPVSPTFVEHTSVLLAHLETLAESAKTAPPLSVDERLAVNTALARMAKARGELESLLQRTDVEAEFNPKLLREQYFEFARRAGIGTP
jgi:HK97 family phage prohead protease